MAGAQWGRKHVWKRGLEGHGQELCLCPQLRGPQQVLKHKRHVQLGIWATPGREGVEGLGSEPEMEVAWTGQGQWGWREEDSPDGVAQ